MCSERKHGLSTEQVPMSAYVGGSKNLKDLKQAALIAQATGPLAPVLEAGGDVPTGGARS